MQQLLPPGIKVKVARKLTVLRDGIRPFCEKPSANTVQRKEEPASTAGDINASELFSLFTANIIKERIIFTR